ncbi:MAG: PEP-CTERM sorting domain-containing protein [Candidatus Thiodiazotropha sp.]
MDKIKCLFFLGLTGFISAADALPIFSHTTDGLGLYTISVDGSNEPTGLAGLNVDNIIGTAVGNDYGINYSDYFSIIDADSDNLLQFTFTDNNISELTGTAFYVNEAIESFAYSFVGDLVDPPSPAPSPTPTPTPNVPEPSTFLLLGAGLVGIGITRLGRRKP